MFSPRRTALYLAIGAMALAAGEASAGCKSISGSLVCATWIKGSEICDITSTGGPELVSATCTITGVNIVDGGEGDIYCASGALPPGECTPGESEGLTSFSSSAKVGGSSKFKAEKKKPKKPKKCKPKHHGKHDGKHHGHDDSCVDLEVPGDSPFLTEVASPPECEETSIGSGIFDCTATAEIFPPEGSTCSNGEPAADFTASEMLAIVEACVDNGDGVDCDTIYDYCTLTGNTYDCTDISFQYPAPDDPYCSEGGGGY